MRIGLDVQSVEAVADSWRRFGTRYLERVFTAEEQQAAGVGRDDTHDVAARLTATFAAKEAVAKTLRPRVEEALAWPEIATGRAPDGSVTVTLLGGAAVLAERVGLSLFSVSTTRADAYAMATAIALSAAESEGGPLTRSSSRAPAAGRRAAADRRA